MNIINNKSLKILFATIIGLLLIVYKENAVIHLFAIWGLAVYASSLVAFDITHPYCWFSITFALYNTAYTILYVLGYDVSAGYSGLNAVYTIIAMGIVLFIVGGVRIDTQNPLKKGIRINPALNEVVFFLLALASIAFSIILLRRGYSGKKDMQAADDIFYKLGVHIVRWMMVLMVIQMNHYFTNGFKKKTIKYLVVSVIAASFLSLCTGERDILFRAVLLIIFILFYYRIIRIRHIFLAIPAGVILMVLSVYYKYYALRGVRNTRYTTGNLIYQFLMTDFHATGRNTQFLINNLWTKGYFGIKMFFNELFRGIVPFVSYINPSNWYNYQVYPGSFKGQAFTLVGFGHVISGLSGVILVFIMLGLFIRFTYRNSRKSLYSLSFYLYSISIVAGSYRATLNTIVNMSIKGALVGILISWFLSKFTITVRKKRWVINENNRVLRESR